MAVRRVLIDCNTHKSSLICREWRHLSYEPKRFGFCDDEAGKSCEPKDVNSHTLPQFSSARAPKVRLIIILEHFIFYLDSSCPPFTC